MVECCPTCGKPAVILMDDRANEIAAQFGSNLSECRGARQSAGIVQARKAIIRDMMERGKSYPQIGRYLNRDHTTIMHHARRMGISR